MIVKEKLASVLIDLKTAETIISILSADLKLNSELDVSGEANPSVAEWSVIKCKNGVGNQAKTRNTINSMCNSATANPFAPLEYLEEPQPETLITNNKKQENRPLRRHRGLKIPTIVNGVINLPRGNSPSKIKTSAIPRRVSSCKSFHSDKMRHVRFIGDSHLKGSAINIKQHLNSKLDVSSIIKPGAKTNQILDIQQNELKSLGKEDFLIVSTGTNDLDNPLTNINNNLAPLMTFINEWKHRNIVIVNVPNQYDLGHDSVSISKKRKIVRYNEKLCRLLNPYSHASIVEVSSETITQNMACI